jgi:outer membrane lipoprotein-sorting protein
LSKNKGGEMKKMVFILTIAILGNLYSEELSKNDISKNNEIITSTKETVNPYLKLKELDLNLKTLKANFKQEIYFKVADMKQNIEGEIYFVKPEKLKIVHTKPNSQIIIVNSKKDIQIIKPQEKQIIKSSWEKWKNNLEPRLKGLFDFGNYSLLEKDADIKSKEEKDGYTIEIKPKKSSYTLILKLNSDFFPVESILDLKDTVIKTVIEKYEKNLEIKPEVFDFKNNGYEVIDL